MVNSNVHACVRYPPPPSSLEEITHNMQSNPKTHMHAPTKIFSGGHASRLPLYIIGSTLHMNYFLLQNPFIMTPPPPPSLYNIELSHDHL